MITYSKMFKVAHYDCDYKGEIKLESIFNYLGEVSYYHNEYLQREPVEASSLSWIISRWKLKFKDTLFANDELKIETWLSKVDKFYALREFLIKKDGKEVLRANALWVLIDTSKKTPTRITEDNYKIDYIKDIRLMDDFIRFPKGQDLDRVEEFRIRRYDIDYNNHVNNARYFAYIMESIDLDYLDRYNLEEIEVYYKKELTYPEKICVGYRQEGNQLYHEINKDSQLSFQALSKWKSKG